LPTVIEIPVLRGDGAGKLSLWTEGVSSPNGAEMVAADRQGDPRRDGEWRRQILLVVIVSDEEDVARLKLCAESSIKNSRFDVSSAVFNVGCRASCRELPNGFQPDRTGAEAELSVTLAYIVAPHEPHFGIEIGADH